MGVTPQEREFTFELVDGFVLMRRNGRGIHAPPGQRLTLRDANEHNSFDVDHRFGVSAHDDAVRNMGVAQCLFREANRALRQSGLAASARLALEARLREVTSIEAEDEVPVGVYLVPRISLYQRGAKDSTSDPETWHGRIPGVPGKVMAAIEGGEVHHLTYARALGLVRQTSSDAYRARCESQLCSYGWWTGHYGALLAE